MVQNSHDVYRITRQADKILLTLLSRNILNVTFKGVTHINNKKTRNYK